MTTDNAPFLPYGRQNVDERDIEAVLAVLRGDYLTTGPAVAHFEASLAELVGAKHVIAVANGTAALHCACIAAQIGPGDRVAVPAVTFLASANCARYVGAEPHFIDVGADDCLMDPASLDAVDNLRAVIPVHMTGCPVDMAPLAELARARQLVVIEDAAHALGARYQGRPIGACDHSDMAIFSFHPVKHITTAEGGAIATNDDQLAMRLRDARNHGMIRDPQRLQRPSPGPWYYEQHELGFNYRITDLQCALGSSQLTRLETFVTRRRELVARYDELLTAVRHVQPAARGPAASESAWHIYVARIDFAAAGVTRALLMTRLRELGVGTQVHYIPVPSQPYYAARGWQMSDFPGAQRYYDRALSLPLYPAMELADVDRVVNSLTQALVE